VDEGGAVHGDAGDEAAFHQVDSKWAEADFDNVAADAPEDRFALLARAVDGAEKSANIFGGEDLRECVEKLPERGVCGGGLRKVTDADLAFA